MARSALATHKGTMMPPNSSLFDQREQFYELILNSLTTGIYVCDNNYVVKFINQAYADYLGLPREQIMGRPITDFIPDSRAPFVTSTGQSEMGNIRKFKGKDGERMIVVNRQPFEYAPDTIGMLSQTLFSTRGEFDAVMKRIEYLDKKVASYERRIRSALSPNYTLQSIIGESDTIQRFKEYLVRFAQTNAPVLILGATGSGKELAASALHCESERREGPFVSINCAAIPKELFESELFGYAPGAFSGAHKDGKVGQLELAHQGTLFLDEIGDTPLPVQAKLLRVLENSTLCRVGSTLQRSVNFRLLAATNRDLKAMIAEGSFREDLYYRLSPLRLVVPSLHQRKEDIPLLVRHMLERMDRQDAKISKSAMQALLKYYWPGNIRELRNVLTSALSLCRNDTINLEDLPPEVLSDFGKLAVEPMAPHHDKLSPAAQLLDSPLQKTKSQKNTNLAAVLADNELHLIVSALNQYDWNVAKAARSLGISRATLYEKFKKYGISRNNYDS